MLNQDLGQRRWHILSTPKCWLKILEMVAALVSFLLCVLFDETATVRMKNAKLHFTISLVFPFPFEDNVTVQVPPGLPPRTFKFDSILLPSSIAFAAVTALAFVLVISIFVLQISHHGTSTEQSYIKWEFFISLGVVFLLLTSAGLWISSLTSLKKGVDNEIHFVSDSCDQFRECEENLPNYVTLYLSTAFSLLLALIWLFDGILIYRTMVHTIPLQITQTNLLRNVELAPVQNLPE